MNSHLIVFINCSEGVVSLWETTLACVVALGPSRTMLHIMPRTYLGSQRKPIGSFRQFRLRRWGTTFVNIENKMAADERLISRASSHQLVCIVLCRPLFINHPLQHASRYDNIACTVSGLFSHLGHQPGSLTCGNSRVSVLGGSYWAMSCRPDLNNVSCSCIRYVSGSMLQAIFIIIMSRSSTKMTLGSFSNGKRGLQIFIMGFWPRKGAFQ